MIEEFPQARLKPQNKRRGQNIGVYSIYGRKFISGKWQPVTEAMGKYLEAQTQDAYDHDTPKAFDVAWSAQEKQRVIELETLGPAAVAPPPPPPPPSREAELAAAKKQAALPEPQDLDEPLPKVQAAPAMTSRQKAKAGAPS